MVTKIAAGVALILMLAAVGTVGVAYYNDPSILESTPAPASAETQPSCGRCCSMPISESESTAVAAPAEPNSRER